MKNVKRGSVGENMAVAILQRRGYQIIERNYRCHSGEIDIICEKQKALYFVEVKARWGIKKGYPEEAVTPKKLERIKKSIYTYLIEKSWIKRKTKLIVVAIIFEDGNAKYKIIDVDSI